MPTLILNHDDLLLLDELLKALCDVPDHRTLPAPLFRQVQRATKLQKQVASLIKFRNDFLEHRRRRT